MNEREITDEMVEAGARAAVRCDLGHISPSAVRRILAAARGHDPLVARITALEAENERLRRVARAAQEIHRCSYPVPAETLLKHHRWDEFSAALAAEDPS